MLEGLAVASFNPINVTLIYIAANYHGALLLIRLLRYLLEVKWSTLEDNIYG